MELKSFCEKIITQSTQIDTKILELSPITGGDVNKSYKVTTTDNQYFLKLNNASFLQDMFLKEALALEHIKSTNTLNTPKVIGSGELNETQFLLLEWIEKGYRKQDYWYNFAENLAKLHAVSDENFGYETHNYIGTFPQLNTPTDDWITFFIEQRLKPQIAIAFNKQLIDKWLVNKFEVLFIKLSSILPKNIKPSLLHGDLWHGNYLTNTEGEAVVIDPAIYFGNSEAEIAFTELFGRMDDKFYHRYFEINPSEISYEDRADIYNLYPLLVHLNLFGTMYLSGIENVLKRFV